MEFDSQERSPIFYIIVFGLLIFAIIFFVNNVKKAVNSSKAKNETESAKANIEIVMYDC